MADPRDRLVIELLPRTGMRAAHGYQRSQRVQKHAAGRQPLAMSIEITRYDPARPG
jgi:hypothetical protein